jgi:hypothetical protein
MAALALLAGCAQPPAAPPGTPPPPPATAAPPTNLPLPGLLYLPTPAVQARFGPPHHTRRDGGAEVWGYDAPATCSVNLVLQRERGGQKVVHAQARLAPGANEAACLRAIERK